MNTSNGFSAIAGGKKVKSKGKPKRGGGTQKLPPGLAKRMANKREDHQPVPDFALSSYGRRRKAKMKGT